MQDSNISDAGRNIPKVLETEGEVIDALGGTAAVAKLCGIGQSAVSNWRKDGIPPGRHYILFRACQRAGLRVGDGVFKDEAA